MTEWSKGKRALDSVSVFYEIRPSNISLQDCEILHQGQDVVEESAINRENICWLRDQCSKIRCCYYIDNSFFELNFKQLDTIFGDEIRKGGVQKNEQLLANGIVVPIVPDEFKEEILNKYQQKKRRVLFAQRIKKKNLKDMNTMLWYFNMNCAPTTEELHQSIHIIPPNLLRSIHPKKQSSDTTTPIDLRERILGLLETTRKKIKKHPVYNKKLEPLLFENLENVSDLLKLTVEDEKGNKINISQHLVSFYHLLFPSQIQ